MKKQFVIATVSTQVQNNFIAWSKTIDYADNMEAANTKANHVWAKMCNEFDNLVAENPESGFVMGESVIIHDGENIY